MASLIKGLVVVDESKPDASGKGASDPVKKFVEAMTKQIQNIRAEEKGETLPPKTRKLYWNKGNNFYVQCAHGTEKIDLGGGSAVKAGPKVDDAVKVFQTFIDEADKALKPSIIAAGDAIGAKLQGRKRGVKKSA
jgi:hypothetical protein